MKTNGKHEVIAQIARQSLVLATLLAMVLSTASISHAQSSASSSATPAAKPTAAAKTPASTAAKPPAKGQHEGITVHGHWTIEVRNPDGKVASHTEFENSLVQPYGATQLAEMLLGTLEPGGYKVYLSNGEGSFNGPCAPINQNDTTCYLVGSLISPAPSGFLDLATGCGYSSTLTNQITSAGPCFPLSIAPISVAGSVTGLSFMGTAVASTTTSITDVELAPLTCPGPPFTTVQTTSPSTCAQGSAGTYSYLTHATLPTAVPITAAGQLIAVTMQLSFQ